MTEVKLFQGSVPIAENTVKNNLNKKDQNIIPRQNETKYDFSSLSTIAQKQIASLYRRMIKTQRHLLYKSQIKRVILHDLKNQQP